MKDVYRIPGSTDEYWQAFQHVNTEIQRSLDEGPEYKTDLVLRPQVFDISARQNSPLPDLVPYMDADQPLSAPVGRPSQIRRSSQWFVYVTEGEELHLELQRIQIGSFRDSVTYLVEGLGGMIIAQGQLERGVNERQQVTVPVPPGIYSVRIEPGSGAVTPVHKEPLCGPRSQPRQSRKTSSVACDRSPSSSRKRPFGSMCTLKRRCARLSAYCCKIRKATL